jgi:GNAT superfamily N-acetyltransferase
MASARPTAKPSLTDVSVRDATPAEYGALREIVLAAYREYAAVLAPAVLERYLLDVADVEAHARAGSQLVAEHAGRIAGTVSFFEEANAEGFAWPDGWAGLRALAVDPGARGLGAGRALMDACLDRARAAGKPVLCLHTAAFMTAAVTMYESMGFRRVPEYDFEGGSHLRLDRPEPVLVTAYRLDL